MSSYMQQSMRNSLQLIDLPHTEQVKEIGAIIQTSVLCADKPVFPGPVTIVIFYTHQITTDEKQNHTHQS